MSSDTVGKTASVMILAAITAALVAAALYAIFGKLSTPSERKRKAEIISGFRVAGKMLVSFAVACVLILGFFKVQRQESREGLLAGLLLIAAATLLMSLTVRFWVVGFHYFVASAGAWSIPSIVLAPKYHTSYASAVCCAIVTIAMGILTSRFDPEERAMSLLDSFSVVVAALCLMAGVATGAQHKELLAIQLIYFTFGDLTLLLCWAIPYSVQRSRI